MKTTSPAYLQELREADRLKAAFISEFGVRPIKWSSYNLSRMLRLTGERPERVAEMKAILCPLGLGDHGGQRYYSWICTGGVFDHGQFWGRGRTPIMMVGHPYQISQDERSLLAELAQFATLQVHVDDRPSYYGFSTHHVRISLTEVRRPWCADLPSTSWTRQAARAARRAFAEEFGRPAVIVA
jgi:hypothetical protein